MLISSFASCGEAEELELLFLDRSVYITLEESTLLVGTAGAQELKLSELDYLVIPDFGEKSLSGLSHLTEACKIKNIYIPDCSAQTEGYEECSALLGKSDAFVVRVEGSMSFGLGAASVSCVASLGQFGDQNEDGSLMVKIGYEKNRILLCGGVKGEGLSEFSALDGNFDAICLTEAQKGCESVIIDKSKNPLLVFSGCEPYASGDNVYREKVTLVCDGKKIGVKE